MIKNKFIQGENVNVNTSIKLFNYCSDNIGKVIKSFNIKCIDEEGVK